MPIQYAVLELIPNEGIAPEDANHWNSESIYHPTPQEVAESSDRGVFALVNTAGNEQVTAWINIECLKEIEDVIKSKKNNKPPLEPHTDILGNVLEVGDFVSYSDIESPRLFIGIVVSFTNKKVRIAQLFGRNSIISKNADGLIQIHPDHLTF